MNQYSNVQLEVFLKLSAQYVTFLDEMFARN